MSTTDHLQSATDTIRVLDRFLPLGVRNPENVRVLESFQSNLDMSHQDVLDTDIEERIVLGGQVWRWIDGHGWSWSGPVSDFGCSDCGVLLPDGEVYCEECNERFEWTEQQAATGNFSMVKAVQK